MEKKEIEKKKEEKEKGKEQREVISLLTSSSSSISTTIHQYQSPLSLFSLENKQPKQKNDQEVIIPDETFKSTPKNAPHEDPNVAIDFWKNPHELSNSNSNSIQIEENVQKEPTYDSCGETQKLRSFDDVQSETVNEEVQVEPSSVSHTAASSVVPSVSVSLSLSSLDCDDSFDSNYSVPVDEEKLVIGAQSTWRSPRRKGKELSLENKEIWEMTIPEMMQLGVLSVGAILEFMDEECIVTKDTWVDCVFSGEKYPSLSEWAFQVALRKVSEEASQETGNTATRREAALLTLPKDLPSKILLHRRKHGTKAENVAKEPLEAIVKQRLKPRERTKTSTGRETHLVSDSPPNPLSCEKLPQQHSQSQPHLQQSEPEPELEPEAVHVSESVPVPEPEPEPESHPQSKPPMPSLEPFTQTQLPLPHLQREVNRNLGAELTVVEDTITEAESPKAGVTNEEASNEPRVSLPSFAVPQRKTRLLPKAFATGNVLTKSAHDDSAEWTPRKRHQSHHRSRKPIGLPEIEVRGKEQKKKRGREKEKEPAKNPSPKKKTKLAEKNTDSLVSPGSNPLQKTKKTPTDSGNPLQRFFPPRTEDLPSTNTNYCPVIVGSRLDGRLVSMLKFSTKKLGGRFAKAIDEDTSHLVVLLNEGGRAARTLKLLKAVVSDIPVVSFDWVLASSDEGKWLEYSKFIVFGDQSYPQVQATQPQLKLKGQLFTGKKFLFYGEFEGAEPDQLMELASLGGASFFAKGEPPRLKDTNEMMKLETDPLFLLFDPKRTTITPDVASDFTIRCGFNPINFHWFLDSISARQVLDVSKYHVSFPTEFETQQESMAF